MKAPPNIRRRRSFLVDDRRIASTSYTAPTAIRAFIKWGDRWPMKHDLSSFACWQCRRADQSEAWMWYSRDHGGRCPHRRHLVADGNGHDHDRPLPGAIATKPARRRAPLPGIIAEVVDKKGWRAPTNMGGFLVLRQPRPSMLRTIYGDDERYRQQYWSQVPGCYSRPTRARQDEDGHWIMGRVDDVLNAPGHGYRRWKSRAAGASRKGGPRRRSSAGPTRSGEGIACFVTLKSGIQPTDALKNERANMWS